MENGMSKYIPAFLIAAFVAIAAFAVDYENWGNASIDTSGNAIFGGTVTATGRVSAAGFTSTATDTNTTVYASTSVRSPKVYLTTNGVNVGWFEVVDITNLVFIAGAITNGLDANGIGIAN